MAGTSEEVTAETRVGNLMGGSGRGRSNHHMMHNRSAPGRQRVSVAPGGKMTESWGDSWDQEEGRQTPRHRQEARVVWAPGIWRP